MAICAAAGCGLDGTEIFRLVDPARRAQVVETVALCRTHAAELRADPTAFRWGGHGATPERP